MAKEKKREIGRPTKYKPEYCDMLETHMARGLSFESFAAIADVCDDTLREWESVHPDFSAAKKKAFAKSRMFWETLAIDNINNTSTSWSSPGAGSESNSKTFNQTVWIFNMKNRFPNEWREKKEIDQTVKAEVNVTYDTTYGGMSLEELEKQNEADSKPDKTT